MKVLHVAESAKGGVGTYINELAGLQSMPASGLQTRVIAPLEHGAIFSRLPSSSVIYFRRPKRSFAALWRLALVVRESSRNFKPDIIHAHSTFAGVVVRVLRILGIVNAKIVYCPHGWAFDIQADGVIRKLAELIERVLFSFTDAGVMVSRHELKQAERIGLASDRLTLVLNGISRQRETGLPATWDDRRLKVLFVGRLDYQKGVGVLISAAAELKNEVVVRVIGDAVVGEARWSELPTNVSALGWLMADEVAAQLAACDVVVVPSRWEGFGLVALEAMRAGRAIIASRVGGLPEIVVDGETGILVEPGSSEELSAALKRCTRFELLVLGNRGKQRFNEYFTIDRVDRELRALYYSLLKKSVLVH